jgi:hypothetical protein
MAIHHVFGEEGKEKWVVCYNMYNQVCHFNVVNEDQQLSTGQPNIQVFETIEEMEDWVIALDSEIITENFNKFKESFDGPIDV